MFGGFALVGRHRSRYRYFVDFDRKIPPVLTFTSAVYFVVLGFRVNSHFLEPPSFPDVINSFRAALVVTKARAYPTCVCHQAQAIMQLLHF